MAATGDMSVVSREYEKSIINAWKNFVAGDIVRMVGCSYGGLLIISLAVFYSPVLFYVRHVACVVLVCA